MPETTRTSMTAAPPQVTEAYYPAGIASQELLLGGHINTTFLITDSEGQKSILQRLNHSTDNSMAVDYQVVSSHLEEKGWEMAQLRETVDGKTYLSDNREKLWRSLSYIESESSSVAEGSIEANVALGGLLGKLHRDLSQLDYQPRTTVSPYRDVRQFTSQLVDLVPEMPRRETRILASAVAVEADKNTINDTSQQLIHGDPRMANALCRQGKPFTFIDWDGLVAASPLFDVGDLIQSVAARLKFEPAGNFSRSDIQDVITAYHDSAELDIPQKVFMRKAMAAGRSVALCLSMRCLIDSVEDYYFGWEASGFDSRQEFNLHRANRQWEVYRSLS